MSAAIAAAPTGNAFKDHVSAYAIQAEPILSMIDYLASQPTLDNVAQHLVLGVASPLPVRSALISVFDKAGVLHLSGAFGLPSEALAPMQHLTLWDSTPMTDTIRKGSPLFFRSRDELAEAYPGLREQDAFWHPTVAWPLTLRGQRLGGLQLLFAEEVDPERVLPQITGIAALLSLYLQHTHAIAAPGRITVDSRGETARPEKGATAEGQQPPNRDLTARQLRILQYMASGLTNGQIAHRVGFSESTVRQETMAIYRYLGVDGRHQAVAVAGPRGLLRPVGSSPSQPTSSVSTGSHANANGSNVNGGAINGSQRRDTSGDPLGARMSTPNLN